MKSIVLLALAYFVQLTAIYSQTVNAYAQVTAINGTTLTLANVNEVFHSFIEGEKVMIMQMQDNVIGTNTNNNVNFGNLANIQSAGLYEISTIQARPNATTVVLNQLVNSYNICNNCRVQLISFRKLGNPNFTTTGNITGLPWNGNIGGVVAFEVQGNLILNHNILANGIGFRGGQKSNDWNTNPGCRETPYIANNANYGFKGEGIYRVNNNNYRNCRARVLNGGGGGNDHNGGGGGGGNFTQGGHGGFGWNSGNYCPNSAGGIGGLELSSVINVNRIFMGGGGGGGQQNNSVGTDGGNGGGIIYIKAQAIQTNGIGTRFISANGINTANGGNDATGGGGAGGSIILDIPFYQIANTCPLYVQTNGGNTGNVGHAQFHGAGGAGAKGPIFFYTFSQPQNVFPEANNGNPGCNNNANPCISFGGEATPGDAIFYIGNNITLSTTQIFLKATLNEQNQIVLNWNLSNSFANAQKFIVMKSVNNQEWTEIYQTEYLSNLLNYTYKDSKLNENTLYYQVILIEADGEFQYSNIANLSIDFVNIHIAPNPFYDQFLIEVSEEIKFLKIYDIQGNLIQNFENLNQKQIILHTENYANGMYIIEVHTEQHHFLKKLLKK